MFSLFKKKDPVCGMPEEKGKGTIKDGNWFCSLACQKQYEEKSKEEKNKAGKKSCCCGP